MTQEEIFLAWCKEKGMKFKKTGKPYHHYELNFAHEATLVVQGVSFNLNKMQSSDSVCVYFDENGKWYGGTNMIWNTGLPWEPR